MKWYISLSNLIQKIFNYFFLEVKIYRNKDQKTSKAKYNLELKQMARLDIKPTLPITSYSNM